jgi:hypothetical protein
MKKLSVFRISDKRLCTCIIIIIIIIIIIRVPYLSLFSFIADINLIALKLGIATGITLHSYSKISFLYFLICTY